jgi:hypothetical protein
VNAVTLIAGTVAAVLIWTFDIENPNVTAPLVLAVGAVPLLTHLIGVDLDLGAGRRRRSEPIGGYERGQRDAPETEVNDVERETR